MQETQETWVQSLGWKIPRRGNGNPVQYSFWKNPMNQRIMVGYSLWGQKELDMTEHACNPQSSALTIRTCSVFSRCSTEMNSFVNEISNQRQVQRKALSSKYTVLAQHMGISLTIPHLNPQPQIISNLFNFKQHFFLFFFLLYIFPHIFLLPLFLILSSFFLFHSFLSLSFKIFSISK